MGKYRETLEEKDKYFQRAEDAFAAINNFDKYTSQIDILCQPAIRSSLSINEKLDKADRIIAILEETYPQEEKVSVLKAEVLLARAHLLGGEEAKSLYNQGAALLEKQTPTKKISMLLLGLYFYKKIGTELSLQQRESKIRELIKIFPEEYQQMHKIKFYYKEGMLGANLTRKERDKKCWHLCNLSNQEPFIMAHLLLNSEIFNSEETTETEKEKNIYQAANILKNEYLKTTDKEMLSLLGYMYHKGKLGKNLHKEIAQDIAYTLFSIANGEPDARSILDLILEGFKPAPRQEESLKNTLSTYVLTQVKHNHFGS